MASGGFTVAIDPSSPVRDTYVLGLLNSRLLFWELQRTSNLFRGGWRTCTKQYFGELPIALPREGQHDGMVRMVEAMNDAKKGLMRSKSDKDKDYYRAKCIGLDRQIDSLVYEIYDLNAEEIRIVENSVASQETETRAFTTMAEGGERQMFFDDE